MNIHFCGLLTLTILLISPTAFAANPQKLSLSADFTYGQLGPKRSNEFVHGEMACITGRLSGLSIDNDSRAKYSVEWELIDSNSKSIESDNFGERKGLLSLGGNSTRISFQLLLPSALTPGSYKLRISAKDLGTSGSAAIELTLLLKPIEGIALSDVKWTRNKEGLVDAGAVFVEGEGAIIRYSLVGLEKQNGQWKIGSKLRILDQSGNPIIKHDHPTDLKVSAPVYGKMTLWGSFYAHRAGKYILELEVIDEVSMKSSIQQIPFCVVGADMGM